MEDETKKSFKERFKELISVIKDILIDNNTKLLPEGEKNEDVLNKEQLAALEAVGKMEKEIFNEGQGKQVNTKKGKIKLGKSSIKTIEKVEENVVKPQEGRERE